MLFPQQQQDLRELVTGGFLPELERWAKRSTAPFWWRDPSGKSPSGYRGGTICFVHTGHRIVGITNEHVHREILEIRSTHPGWHCQIGGHTFDPQDRLIAADKTLDLATYDFSEVSVNAVDADIHYPETWPPVADDGAVGLVGGWPWSLSGGGETNVTHEFLHFVCRLQRNADLQIGAPTFTRESVPWGGRTFAKDMNLGGMSGGPLYQLIQAPIVRLRLVGVIYEYQPTFELVLGRGLGAVAADGTLLTGPL